MGTTTDDDLEHWHEHSTAEERAAERAVIEEHRQRRCEAKKVEMQRKADGWNRREAAAWAQLQEACADDSPAGQNSCSYLTRMYQGTYSPTAAAEYHEWLLGEMAAACAPPKSPKQLECEGLAKQIERHRSYHNDRGISYWTGRAAEAGCETSN